LKGCVSRGECYAKREFSALGWVVRSYRRDLQFFTLVSNVRVRALGRRSDPCINKMSPQRDVTLLARRVLPLVSYVALLHMRVLQTTTTDTSEAATVTIFRPPTLCVGGPVISEWQPITTTTRKRRQSYRHANPRRQRPQVSQRRIGNCGMRNTGRCH